METVHRAVHPWVSAARAGVRVGVQWFGGGTPDFATLAEQARRFESLGFESVWLADHPLLMADGWITLAALARETTSIRLGVMVTCVAYRHPVLVARAVADVDRFSGGRVVLGLGSGDLPHEFAAMGLAYGSPADRFRRLEESITTIPRLLAGEPVTFEGSDFAIRGAVLALPLAGPPGVPLLVGGGGRQTLRLVAEHADACNVGATPWAGGAYDEDDIRTRLDTLRAWCETSGRPYDSILRTMIAAPIIGDSRTEAEARLAAIPERMRGIIGRLAVVGTTDDLVEHFDRVIDAGIQYIVIGITDPAMAAQFATEVMPRLHGIAQPMVAPRATGEG